MDKTVDSFVVELKHMNMISALTYLISVFV